MALCTTARPSSKSHNTFVIRQLVVTEVGKFQSCQNNKHRAKRHLQFGTKAAVWYLIHPALSSSRRVFIVRFRRLSAECLFGYDDWIHCDAFNTSSVTFPRDIPGVVVVAIRMVEGLFISYSPPYAARLARHGIPGRASWRWHTILGS